MSGQQASATQGAQAALLLRRWGRPRWTDEPVSHTIAMLQREYGRVTSEADVWHRLGNVARVSRLERDAQDILDYLDSLYPAERRTEFSEARDVDHYVALMQESDVPRGRDYARIKEETDIVDFIGREVALRPGGGGRFVGLCPFHEEKTPSFTVFPEDKRFHCFGCGERGDVIDFAKARGLSL